MICDILQLMFLPTFNNEYRDRWWLGGPVVSMSDSRSRGRRFDSRPVHCQTTTTGQVVNAHLPLSPSNTIWYQSKGGDALRPGK